VGETLAFAPYTSDARRTFLRWSVDIPAGTTITAAYAKFKAAMSLNGNA
jgi:hypothetical protein